MVAFTLAPNEIKKLRDQFKAFDTDGSGTLCLAEFRSAMEKNAQMDPKSIADLFAKVGELLSACLSYSAATPACPSACSSVSQIDSDHTGLISYSEFISASLSTAVHLNEDRLCAAFDK